MTVQAFGAAHGNEGEGATIELELEPEELRTLTQPTATGGVNTLQGGSSGGDEAAGGSGTSASRARLALLLCASTAAILAGVGDAPVARVSALPAPRFAAVTARPLELQTPPPQPPVRFANPFDASEVFEFPAGTSRSAARAEVAKLLRERARGRLYLLSAKRTRHHCSRPTHAGEGGERYAG